MNETNMPGIKVTKQDVSNMRIEHFNISTEIVQAIVQQLKLTEEAQNEVVDKLVDRTPEWMDLESEEQTNKIKAALIEETIIEFLRLNEYVRKDVEMIDIGISDDLSILASAFYIKHDKTVEKELKQNMSKEELDKLENQINILDGSINIIEEAKKKLNKQNAVPFKNRKARRAQMKKERLLKKWQKTKAIIWDTQ